MLKNIEINNFKCFESESIDLKPLTLITGTNSSGKSTLIQAILLSGDHEDLELKKYLSELGSFDELKNKHINPREFSFKVTFLDDTLHTSIVSKESDITPSVTKLLSYPSVVTYLSANRSSLDEINSLSTIMKDERKLGIDGKYIISYYEKFKNELVQANLVSDGSVLQTLEGQVNYWLKKITDNDYELNTEKVSSSKVKAFYKSDGLAFKPANIGVGVGYLSTIIITCLSAKSGNVIIENPEIHLHPKAQAKLAEFFVFIASKGIQLIIETHNDHLINKTRYEVFNKKINHDDVIIHYKNSRQPFEKITISPKGMFVDKNGENSFPKGFYDATLSEIFSINMGS